MNQVTVILILALASANASKFLQAPEAIQQDKISKQISEDSLTIDGGYNDGHFGAFIPSLNTEVEEIWESETDPRLVLASEFQANAIHKPDELRLKRTDTSLSIVNALDVLRQRIMLEFARRKMNESKAQIQRNRELLIKTGKRSYKNGDEPLNYGLTEFMLRKRTENDDSRRPLPVIPSKRYGTTRPSQNERGYQM